MLSLREIEKVLNRCMQQHLLRYWDELSAEEQEEFVEQLNTIDFEKVNNVFDKAQSYLMESTKKLDDHMKPIPPNQFEAEIEVDPETLESYRIRGLKEISENRVAVLLLAGGQGTRLGVSYPKGMFPLDIPSGKTLFQIQAERIRRVVKLAAETTGKVGRICWYVMTSKATHEATESYLEKHSHFGLNKEDVVLFEQGLLPCFSFDGKIILKKKNCISLAPDGNGGIYAALRNNNILENMVDRGIKYVHVHSVDNILVKVADPVFIGYFATKGADSGAKVVPKENPNEPVGVVCQVDGKFRVVEYSEITEKTANLRNSDGNLVFQAGNICNHIFTVDFLEKVSDLHEHELILHVAKKKIPYVDENGRTVTPKAPNGIKIEKFVFDVFQFSENFVTWEVPRYSEFSPLKNCDDNMKDCPAMCRKNLLNLHKLYIEKSGGRVLCDEVEISPLLSYAGENLEERVNGRVFDSRTVLVADVEQTVNGGERAELGQFPWMALLGYRQKQLDFIEYLCGGTIITETYVLTAAHCIGVGKYHKLVQVRLGEHNLNSKIDCHILNGVNVCADDPVDIPVLSDYRHPYYDSKNLKNDIALVRLKRAITFTDFIQPICLPFERNLEKRILTGEKFTISGWGKTDSRKLGGSPDLQFATVTVWDQYDCNQVVPPEVQPITNHQMCANGEKEDACKGDSGGPLVNSTIDTDDELRNYQVGIVSFASTLTCGVKELPPIYTRVDKYLDWIADNVE